MRTTLILAFLPSKLVFAGNVGVKTCHTISSTVSRSSGVFWPGSPEYARANSHWSNSSSQASACAVEPGTSGDLSTIMKIIGSTRTPFGVKSGGHAMNVGFSSTTGVQISLSRFNKVEYDKTTSTVRVGSGLIWDDVYMALEPHAVIALGGRVSGIGVGGFSTGGGYSWGSNQHGLTIDTIIAHDLILPNGTSVVVTNASHPDLFLGLKGGFNNFGIVTGFTFKAFPQTLVWGGPVIYSGDQFPAISKATKNFSANNKDPKACLITVFAVTQGAPIVNLLLFYDGPVIPPGVFDEFLAIQSLSQDVSTRSYLSLIKALNSGDVGNVRAAFHTVSLLEYSQKILDTIVNETTFWGNKLQSDSGVFISYAVEPFHGLSAHATPSAYPHDTPLLPLSLNFGWTDPAQDDTFFSALKQTVQTIYEAALAGGQDISIEHGKQIRYPNYALYDTPLEQMYGTNVHKLGQLRALHDPKISCLSLVALDFDSLYGSYLGSRIVFAGLAFGNRYWVWLACWTGISIVPAPKG